MMILTWVLESRPVNVAERVGTSNTSVVAALTVKRYCTGAGAWHLFEKSWARLVPSAGPWQAAHPTLQPLWLAASYSKRQLTRA